MPNENESVKERVGGAILGMVSATLPLGLHHLLRLMYLIDDDTFAWPLALTISGMVVARVVFDFAPVPPRTEPSEGLDFSSSTNRAVAAVGMIGLTWLLAVFSVGDGLLTFYFVYVSVFLIFMLVAKYLRVLAKSSVTPMNELIDLVTLVVTATNLFVFVTLLLYSHRLVTFSPLVAAVSLPQLGSQIAATLYWHLVDMIPIIDLWKTVKSVKAPLEPRGLGTELLILSYRIVIVVPFLRFTKRALSRLRESTTPTKDSAATA